MKTFDFKSNPLEMREFLPFGWSILFSFLVFNLIRLIKFQDSLMEFVITFHYNILLI